MWTKVTWDRLEEVVEVLAVDIEVKPAECVG